MQIKISLNNYDLELIKSQALKNWKDKSNREIEPSLYTTACTVEAFVSHLRACGIDLELILPKRQYDPEE